MLTSMSRTIGYSIIPVVSANRGAGPMSIIWWTIGVSGIDAPAIFAISGLHTPRLRGGHPPSELLHPLLGPGDLDPTALSEDVELLVLAHALERQRRHLLGVVDGEDEVRGMPGRAPRVGQRALVDQRQVRLAQLGEVVGDAVADDARADHNDPAR